MREVTAGGEDLSRVGQVSAPGQIRGGVVLAVDVVVVENSVDVLITLGDGRECKSASRQGRQDDD